MGAEERLGEAEARVPSSKRMEPFWLWVGFARDGVKERER